MRLDLTQEPGYVDFLCERQHFYACQQGDHQTAEDGLPRCFRCRGELIREIEEALGERHA